MVRESREFSEHGDDQPESENHYAEIRERLGPTPDVERLRADEATQRQIEIQKHDEASGYGHAIAEHCADREACQKRAEDGTQARKLKGPPGRIPEHATRFTSTEACMAAASSLWVSSDTERQRRISERRVTSARAAEMPQNQLKIVIEQSSIVRFGTAEQILGSRWRTHIEGYTSKSGGRERSYFGPNSELKAVWLMKPDGTWYLETCYAIPRG